MSYVLEDIFTTLKETITNCSEPPEPFEDSFEQKNFWNYLLTAAGYNNLNLTASSVSNWTSGKHNLNKAYIKSLKAHQLEVTKAINEIIDALQGENISPKLIDIFKKHNIYSLLELSEGTSPDYIIFTIIISHPRLAVKDKDNSCLRNLPYSTTYERIIPIDAVQNFFDETLPKYHYAIVFGIPGIGKLCQAVYYVMNNTPTHYYYLNFEDSINDTLAHYSFEDATTTPEQEYSLSSQFKELKKRKNTILIINNVKTDIQNDSDFSSLINLPIRIIFLSSCFYLDSSNILSMPHLSLEQCLNFFYQNCLRLSPSEANDVILRNIIDMIEYHTLSLELIAKLVQNSALSLSDIQSYIRNDPLFDNNTILFRQQKDGCISRNTYRNIILNLFDIDELTSYHELLNYIALLPSTGYNRISFNKLIGDLGSNKINHLINLGWVNLNEPLNTISLHPLIQSCFMQKLAPTPVLCMPFLESYVKAIDSEDYDNELEAIWMGLSILNRIQDNSTKWFEISYMIFNFLRKVKVDYSFIKNPLNILDKITFSEDIAPIKNFYIRHINNMYYLLDSDGDFFQRPDVFKLSHDILTFCEQQGTVTSFSLIDLLIMQNKNLKELLKKLECLEQTNTKVSWQLLMNYYAVIKLFKNESFFQIRRLLSIWHNPSDTFCSQRVRFYTYTDINKLPEPVKAEYFYGKGLDALYDKNHSASLNNLCKAYKYYNCHPKYKFYYKNLNCQYLILFCQRKLNHKLDQEIITSLDNALSELPDFQKVFKKFKELRMEFYQFIDS